MIDKPADWTSFDVVAKVRGQVRHATGNRKAKVGHAGTLDPFATGLLIVMIGAACKKSDKLMKQDKVYEFTVRLGESSTTGDTEGEIIATGDGMSVTTEQFNDALRKFTGEIYQTPPSYSAIKIDGKRAYALARAGQEVHIEPRKITVYSLEVMSFELPEVKCRVEVSSGTYIRSLVSDIGEYLGVGAYCSQLRRISVGDFGVMDAHSPDYPNLLDCIMEL